MEHFRFLSSLCLASGIIISTSIYGQGIGGGLTHIAQQNDGTAENASIKNISGKIKAISHTIPPDTAAYDDCNFTMTLDCGTIDYFITVPMFINRIPTQFAQKKVGDTITVRIIPFEAAPEKVRQTQAIDDINDFEKQMYYADTMIGIKKTKKVLVIDPKKKKRMLRKILNETDKLLSEYNARISINAEEREKEINEFNKLSFKAIQKPYGYFHSGTIFCETKCYDPTLLQGLIDLNEKCKKKHCDLIVIPCISEHEYGKKELLKTTTNLPFIDYGRMKLVKDCLENGILAIDTNAIIKSRQTKDYLPFSMFGDGHFSVITNIYLTDAIVSDLGIKNNDFTIKKSFFHINSMHLPHYSGPLKILTEPIFKTNYKNSDNSDISILVAGDSFAVVNKFNLYMSLLTQSNVKTVMHPGRANLALKEILEGRYDSELQSASLLIFIVSAPHITTLYPTREIVELLSKINKNKVAFYNVPISTSRRKNCVIERPKSFPRSKSLKAIIEASSLFAKYSVMINGKAVFNHDCDFKYCGGFYNFLLYFDPKDFKDGKVELRIEGNAYFKKIILVDDSDCNQN